VYGDRINLDVEAGDERVEVAFDVRHALPQLGSHVGDA